MGPPSFVTHTPSLFHGELNTGYLGIISVLPPSFTTKGWGGGAVRMVWGEREGAVSVVRGEGVVKMVRGEGEEDVSVSY